MFTRSAASTSATRRRINLSAIRDYGVVCAFAALFVALSISTPNFLTRSNLENLLSQQSPTIIAATAATLVVIAGGFDLSIGALAAVSGILAGQLAAAVGAPAAILGAIAAGAALGCFNGAIATRGRINSLIGTLATSYVFRGLATVIAGGVIVNLADGTFISLGQGYSLGMPVSILIMICVAVAAQVVLSTTTYGRRLFAVGANPEAARLSGIRVDAVRASTFVLSGAAAGLAGVLMASQVATAQASDATGLEFTVLAGIVVGGTGITGGRGAVWRTVLGVVFIALIDNGFTLLGIDPIYSQIVKGAVILAAVGFDAWTKRN
jgi:ribose transport system permease protein